MIDEEILNEFKLESGQLLRDLSTLVEQLEAWAGEFPKAIVEEFAVKADRIMDASKTIGMLEPENKGFYRLGYVAQLCKYIGYKASQNATPQLTNILAAFWADAVEVLEELLNTVDKPEENEVVSKNFAVILQGRLKWLLNQVDPVGSKSLSTEEVDELVKKIHN